MNAPLGETHATAPPTASTLWAALSATAALAGSLSLDPPMAQTTQSVKVWSTDATLLDTHTQNF